MDGHHQSHSHNFTGLQAIGRQAAIVQVVVVVVKDCLSTTWPAKRNKWKQSHRTGWCPIVS